MELSTPGQKHYPRYRMPLWHQPQEAFSPELGHRTRFRLVLVEHGTGILRLGEHRLAFVSPALFCLHEVDRPELAQSLDLQAQALYFHPHVINSAFTFDNMRDPTHDFSPTERQDLYCLRPFFERSATYYGHLAVGPLTAQRLAALFQSIAQELRRQPDTFWPCRSRSYFLEILFLVDRLFAAPPEIGSLPAPEQGPATTVDDIGPVILYLHRHYEEKVTIDQLTRAFHVNRTTLAERFRAATGMSIMAYLIRLRIHLGALLLRDTRLPVEEVMGRVGFSDSTHFGRTFRKHTGLTPSEYRHRHCWIKD